MTRQKFFAKIVQTGAIVAAMQHGRGADWAMSVMAEALLIPAYVFPTHYEEVARWADEFIAWQVGKEPAPPDWWDDKWISDEW